MRLGFVSVLFIIPILVTSGCTQAGRVTGENLTPEEELALGEFLNETQENATLSTRLYKGHTGPQNITQPAGCPETCDDQDNCTYDYCSRETGYECVHAERICPNFVRVCPDGVSVICENICIDNSCTQCEPDCREHQLPPCRITQEDCGPCQVLDQDNCECARIISCVNNDNCCPPGCSYTLDSDCEVPEGECSLDSDCNDENNCTTDICTGMPKKCFHEEITACIPGDNCCPSGCDSAQDEDCPEPELDHIIFTQILYDPPGKEDKEEWLEIYNPTDSSLELSGWSITDNSGTWEFPDQTATGPRSYLIIARDSEGFSNLTGCSADIGTFTRGLNNPGDQLSLKNPDLRIIDFVAWERGYNDAYPEWDISAGDGKSIKRKPLTDTDSPGDWLSEQEPEPNC